MLLLDASRICPLRYSRSVDDAGLIEGIRSGDESCWQELVDRHSGLVWRVARTVVNDDHAATDAMQTAWLRLLENVDRIADPRAVKSWLCTTARREAIALSKRTARQRPREPAVWLLDAPTSSDTDPGELTASSDQNSIVLDELRKLSEKCQQLLTLQAHKVSYDEISELMDMPVGSIGPTRARCLERLRSAPAIVELERAGA